MLCYAKRHTLLLKYFIPFLRCIGIVGETSDSIFKPFMIVHAVPFPPRLTLKLHTRCICVEMTCHGKNRILCYEKRHTLRMKYVITFLRVIRKMRRPCDITWQLLVCETMLFSVEIDSQIAYEMSDLTTPLSAWELGCYATRRDIHCY